MEVDYAGLTTLVIDPRTREITQAENFVGVLWASGLIYTEAQVDQSKPDWTRGHVRMFEYFVEVPKIVRTDNLGSGVSKAHFYETDLNPTYHKLSVY